MVKNSVSIILPTYNEKGNIIKLIEEIFFNLESLNIKKEIIVVDDNSPDKTGYYTKNKFKDNQNIKVFIRTKERGFATAIRHGIEKSTGDIIIIMDTDFNHDPLILPQLIKLLDFYDLVSGSRYVMGGNMPSLFRYLSSYTYNFFIRLVLRTQIQDNLCGYFSIKKKKLSKLNFNKIFFGYGDYFFRLIYFAEKRRFKMLEIPVVYRERIYGSSKYNLIKVLIKYTHALLSFRFSSKKESK